VSSPPTNDLELALKNKGYKFIVGVDEVGRGPLCGPVVAAAVCIPDGFDTSEIRDSKQLSSNKRSYLYDKIRHECFNSLAQVDATLIDIINIREATKLAMGNAISFLQARYPVDFVLIDGNFVPESVSIPARAIIGGDRKSVSIAAASIIAKVWRDEELRAMHCMYPVYNWKQNKGYGTQEHRDAIALHGITDYHRKSFGGVREYVKVAKD
jgi:ribonuclease HII